MGLALGNFFQPNAMLWVAVVVLAAVTVALTVAWSKLTQLPFLAAPFILVLWAVWPFAEYLGLAKVTFGAFADAPLVWGAAAISTFGSALFAPSILSGLLFLVGLLISNWRHAIVAALGAVTAIALAEQAGAPGTAINSGFIGFNGVLQPLRLTLSLPPTCGSLPWVRFSQHGLPVTCTGAHRCRYWRRFRFGRLAHVVSRLGQPQIRWESGERRNKST